MIETVYLLDILNFDPPTRRYGSQQSASYYGIYMNIRDVINDKTVLILGICLISAAL